MNNYLHFIKGEETKMSAPDFNFKKIEKGVCVLETLV